MCVYCQFVMNNEEKYTKNYKYDRLIGNLSYYIIKHNIILPTEIIILKIQEKSLYKYK